MKNKEKYSLNKLRISVTYAIVGIADIEIHHGIKRIYYKSYDVEEFASRWIIDFIKWLEKDDGEEYKPQILTDKEKAYLSAVINPFREKVEYIQKCFNLGSKAYIYIYVKKCGSMIFPTFRKETMYKEMEEDRKYTLEELGL